MFVDMFLLSVAAVINCFFMQLKCQIRGLGMDLRRTISCLINLRRSYGKLICLCAIIVKRCKMIGK